MEDEKIIALYFDRDETAISETDKKYGRYLTKIAYNILYDIEDSKEGVNDTYLAAWNSIPPNVPEIFSVYLSRITRRVCIDIFRKKNSEKRRASQFSLSLDELSVCDTSTPENIAEAKLLAKTISDFLRCISENARNVFICRYYHMDSVKDIAKYCNMSQSNVKTTLHRTRCELKEYLKKEGFDV